MKRASPEMWKLVWLAAIPFFVGGWGQPVGAVESLWTRPRGEDWPQFLGPRRNSTSRETGIRTDWSREKLPVVWHLPVGEGYSIGSVAKGRYVHFDRVGNEARVLCVHAETGRQLWEYRYPTDYVDMYGYDGGPRASPLIDEDRVYLFGVEGMLLCLELESGRLLWQVDTTKRFGVIQNFFGVGSNPIVDGDLLWVMVGGSPPEDRHVPLGQLDRVRSNGSALVAFDKRTGQVRHVVGDELASYASLQLVELFGRRWLLAFARGGLLSVNPATATVDFHFPWRAKILESVNASTPVIVGNEVFISETYGPGSALLRLQPEGFQVVWQDTPENRHKAFQAHWNTPIYHDGYLYGCSGRHTYEAQLRCIEWKTGKICWNEPGLTRTSLLYVDGHFVCLGEDGVLRLIQARPDRFQQVSELVVRLPDSNGFSRSLLRYPCWAAPILSHGLLFVRGEGRVVCLELIPP
ncbi:MAG: hypothetical protein KatS3mg110_1753 [Pirellulaceae bacterium]|nr:MAG: hypothetical protein KatS3mg110_1753 [Pirellulaceae bacterium]